MSTNINKSRSQIAFCALETVTGTPQRPVAADYVRPAGDVIITQTPTYTDSSEKAETLDVLDKFRNAYPPASVTLPMYLRLTDMTTAPQGVSALKTLLGGYQAASVATIALAAELAVDATTLTYKTLSGILPASGVIQIGAEQIRYEGKTATSSTTGTLSRLQRGYNDTTAALAAVDTAGTLLSQCFYPTTASPSMTVWMTIDKVMYFATGVTMDKGSVDIKNQDAVMFNMTGQGMRMGWAGESTLTALAANGATTINVANPKRFAEGALIYNKTKNDYGTVGYMIESVDYETGDVVIDTAVTDATGWATSDVITWWLPDPGAMASSTIENNTAKIRFDGENWSLRSTTISVNTPKKYFDDIVGTEFTTQYAEDQRSTTLDVNAYYVSGNEEEYIDAQNNINRFAEIQYGEASGKTMLVVMPRLQLSSPEPTFEPPVTSLKKSATALGTIAEDSIYFVIV